MTNKYRGDRLKRKWDCRMSDIVSSELFRQAGTSFGRPIGWLSSIVLAVPVMHSVRMRLWVIRVIVD